MWSVLVFILIIFLIFWVFFQWSLSYWSRRGVDGVEGPLPLVGNMKDYVMGKMHFGLVFDKFYKQFPTARYIGIFKFTSPTLLIRDLDVVREILLGKFHAFEQNEFFVNETIDPLLVQSPFLQLGDQWKNTRAMLSPIFTPSRVKQMFPIVMNDAVQKFIAHINDNIDTDMEAKNLCFKYTMENVASCAFGLNGNCFGDPENSEFFINGSNVFAPNMLFNLTTLFFPSLTHIIKVPAISPRMDKWLRSIVEQVVVSRKDGTEKSRNDFLQFLLNLKETKPEQFNKDTITGHCLTFLTEGTETSSITLTYVLYELALHPETQQRLLEELNTVTDEGKFPLTGDLVNELKFMDCVIDETMRLHSPVSSLNKICSKRTQLGPQYADGKDGLVVEPGTKILIPLWSILRDPRYFSNPEKFDPDRHLNEDIPKMSMLMFGGGPRLCLGKNFALFQIKVALAEILKNFKVVLAKKMTVPAKISSKAFLLHCDDGIWIRFETLKNK